METQKTLYIIIYSVLNEYCSTAANVVPSELNVNFARNVRHCVRKTVIERSYRLDETYRARDIIILLCYERFIFYYIVLGRIGSPRGIDWKGVEGGEKQIHSRFYGHKNSHENNGVTQAREE